MIHFDEVKEKTIEYLKSLEKTSEGEFYVIRDVYGKVAVYVTGGYQPETVRNQLAEVIGQNWIGQVRSIEKSSILFGEVSGNVEQLEEHIYYGERPLVKKNWNNAFTEKVEGDAKTVTFYSYKGGVGRTTTLALSALQMARKGKKTVVIDMDLEAPGLSTILKPEEGMDYPKYGVVDFLVECEKENSQIDLNEYIYPFVSKELLGMDGGELFVMQAANLSVDDYEKFYYKLSRIDFNMPKFYGQGNPVTRLLERINEQYRPDYIFMDARAGIHDIGGLTLFHYSDEVVALFYGNAQNMIGMNFVLPKLCRQDIPFYLINTPVPVLEDAAEEEIDYYVNHSFFTLQKAGYFEEIPDIYDESSAHYPMNIYYDAVAANVNSESKLLQLLMRDGDKNIYRQIADMLETTPECGEVEEYPALDEKKEILQAIGGIFPFDTPAAEDEFQSYETLRKNFYPLKEYKYIFDNSKFMITGSKGSGKTALFRTLKFEKYIREMAEYIGIPEREILSTTWLTGLDKTGDFPNKANFRTIGKTQNTEYYTIYWKILAVRTLKEIIRRYDIKTFGYYEEIISCRYSQMLDCIQKYGNMNEELSELLDETNRCLEKEGKVVVITYDSLDFCMDREVRGGLISELLAFWAENNLRYQGLRAKIFLRNDIFKKEIMLTDKIKLNNYRGNIEWTYDYLLAMLWKRMMEADVRLKERLKGVLEKAGYSLEESKLVGIMPRPSEEINKVILNTLVGEKMGKGNKTYTYNWIIYRLADANLKIVPRSMIKLFSSAARLEEMEEGNRKWEKILSPKSLKNSADDVSADRVADMKEEYSEYKQIFEDLRKYCSLFPADEEIFYSALVKCGIQKEELKTVVDHLIEIGVLKVYEKKKKDAPVRYHIPDIYLTGMGLTRKGDR